MLSNVCVHAHTYIRCVYSMCVCVGTDVGNVCVRTCVCRCHGGPQQQEYRFELELFGEIDPSKSKMRKTDRHMTVILEKKDKKGHFWPRLTESKAKIHFVHTDFNKWKDEDDTSDEDDRMNDDFQSVHIAHAFVSHVCHMCVTCLQCHVTRSTSLTALYVCR